MVNLKDDDDDDDDDDRRTIPFLMRKSTEESVLI